MKLPQHRWGNFIGHSVSLTLIAKLHQLRQSEFGRVSGRKESAKVPLSAVGNFNFRGLLDELHADNLRANRT